MTKDKPQSKTARKPRFPRWARIVTAFFAAILLLLLSFPIWSVWLAKPIANSIEGLEVQSVRRLARDQWEVNGLSYKNPSIDLRIEHAHLPSATQLIFNHFSVSDRKQDLVVENWILDLLASDSANEIDATGPSPESIRTLVGQIHEQLDRYFASISMRNGELLNNGQDLLRSPELKLESGTLAGSVDYVPQKLQFDAEIDLNQDSLWKIKVHESNYDLATQTSLRFGDENLSLEAAVISAGNELSLAASWPMARAIKLPAHFSLSSGSFVLDGRYPFWNEAPPLQLAFNINWDGDGYSYRILGSDTISSEATNNILIDGEGTFDVLALKTIRIELPWLTVESERPLELDFRLENPLSEAELFASIDLSKLPMIETSGQIQAALSAKDSDENLPIILVSLQGSDIPFYDTTFSNIESEVELIGKDAMVRKLVAQTRHGSQISARGIYHLESQTLENTEITLDLANESQRLRELLPQIEWGVLFANFSISEQLQNPKVKGSFSILDLTTYPLNTLDLEGDFEGSLETLSAELFATRSKEKIHAAFTGQSLDSSFQLTTEALEISSSDPSKALILKESNLISFSKSAKELTVSPLTLGSASGSEIILDSFSYSDSKLDLHAEVVEFEPKSLQAWLQPTIPPIRIKDFDTFVELSKERTKVTSSGIANWNLGDSTEIDLSWLVQNGDGGQGALFIDHLDIGAGDKHILVAEGALPLNIAWQDGTPLTSLNQDSPISFNIKSSPHPDFWRSVEEHFPISLSRPRLNANISGSLANPQGEFNLKLDTFDLKLGDDVSRHLTLSNINASLYADAHTLEVRALEASVGSNSLTAKASLPLDNVDLKTLIDENRLPDLSHATGQARLDLENVSEIKSWLPDFIRHEGRATLRAEIADQNLNVLVDVSNLATRPLPPLGALSNISGQLKYANGVWSTNGISGLAEKSRFDLSGSVDFSKPEKPLYDLSFNSKEFPLIRDSGLLLSGDINLALASNNSLHPTLAGSITLSKGLFLAEPEFFSGSTKSVQNRPPYFAVDVEPFDQWGLNVAIRGDEFLRVSNSFFEGTLSADFNLDGTLGVPLLIGKAEAASGRIFFPASSLRLTRGQAFITRDRPSELRVEAAAEGRLLAHDINLTADGPINKLDLVITTNPALSQVDALLLLTAGTVPTDAYGLAEKSATSLGVFIGKGLFRKLSGGSGDAASRLSIEVGADISRQGKNTIEASYELNDSLSIEGEYDKRDEYNANLKWTIYER